MLDTLKTVFTQTLAGLLAVGAVVVVIALLALGATKAMDTVNARIDTRISDAIAAIPEKKSTYVLKVEE